ncbi:MAG: phosphatidylserine decarboxylase [Candidatus Pacebacteria bacterium]|nr:phosphatidylserine decarboxylase [Candidatus Paceibacterota bacterium]
MIARNTKIIFLSILFFAVAVFGFLSYFNRAPERIIPTGNSVVSPATGDVIHIETADSNEVSFLKKGIQNTFALQGIEPPYTIVVIEMDPMDVHVQRASIEGKIVYQEHIAGKYKNALWSKDVHALANENEKNLLVIENDQLSVGVIQVAGIMARRIISYVSPADPIEKGELYGRIKLGSQVVLILPESLNLEISVGQSLVDGETVVAFY